MPNIPSSLLFLGLGSNLSDPVSQLESGLRSIAKHIADGAISVSRFVITPPMGGMDQPDYVNCVCRCHTRLNPREALLAVQAIEDEHGRTREEHWGPRTLDIDILRYGQERIDEPGLKVPHPGIEERDFVMAPMLELESEFENLDGRAYADIYRALLSRTPSSLKVMT